MTRIAERGGSGRLNQSAQNHSRSVHLAAGPALGYVYQFQVALLHLLASALAHEEAWARLEVIDDVSLEYPDGHPPKVVQVHSEAGSRRLTDKSQKVWKTLGIWSRGCSGQDDPLAPELILFSTQEAKDESGVSLLRPDQRNAGQALSRLEAAASDENGSDTTAADRQAFLDLPRSRRESLVEHIVVVDGATPPVEMRAALTKALMPAHEARFVEDMATAVEGWWWGRLPDALETGAAIGSEELRAQIDAARRRLSDASLPIVRDLKDIEERDLPDGDQEGDLFLVCLDDIRASARRRQTAINDYRLAFAHRSRWTRKGLVTLEEIGSYDDRLVDYWSRGCDEMLRHLDANADSETKATAGHDLWDEMEKNSFVPIRPETVDLFIQNGSFHQLANVERVSWHPDTAAPIYEGQKTP